MRPLDHRQRGVWVRWWSRGHVVPSIVRNYGSSVGEAADPAAPPPPAHVGHTRSRISRPQDGHRRSGLRDCNSPRSRPSRIITAPAPVVSAARRATCRARSAMSRSGGPSLPGRVRHPGRCPKLDSAAVLSSKTFDASSCTSVMCPPARSKLDRRPRGCGRPTAPTRAAVGGHFAGPHALRSRQARLQCRSLRHRHDRIYH
jgi:hypothetical protein